MTIVHDRRTQAYRSPQITNYTQTLLDKNYQQARRYHVESANNRLAQAFVLNGTSHVVDLRERTCTCGEFQEYYLPCCHAVAVCLHQAWDPCEYVDELYSINHYQATYSMAMQPVREENLVDEYSDCEAPELAKQRGHPKQRRLRRDEGEGQVVTCSHCKEKGHNRRSCRNVLQD
jgi:zinc finger SWIM domain-containing protein 3